MPVIMAELPNMMESPEKLALFVTGPDSCSRAGITHPSTFTPRASVRQSRANIAARLSVDTEYGFTHGRGRRRKICTIDASGIRRVIAGEIHIQPTKAKALEFSVAVMYFDTGGCAAAMIAIVSEAKPRAREKIAANEASRSIRSAGIMP